MIHQLGFRRGVAYAFRTSFELPEMRRRLDGVGGRRWIDRCRDEWDEYISSISRGPGEDDMTRLRIIWPDDQQKWVLDVLFESAAADAGARWHAFEAVVADTLTIVDAAEIERVESYAS